MGGEDIKLLREHAKLLDIAREAIIHRDIAGTVLFWNKGAERIYGWSKEEVIGKTTQNILKTILPQPFENIIAHLRKEEYWEGELTHTHKNGSTIIVHSRWVLHKDDEEKILEINEDITAQRQAASKHQESEAKLRHITDAIPASLAYIDKNLHYRMINKTYEQWYGIDAKEVIGKHITTIITPAFLKTVLPHLERGLAGEQVSYERWIDFPTGRRYVHVTYTPDIYEHEVQGLTILAEDLTGFEHIRQRAEQQRGQLEAVFQSIQDGVVVFDMQGNAVIINETWAHIWGYDSVEHMKADMDYFSKTFQVLTLDGEIVPVSEWPVSRVLRGETFKDWELRAIRKDTGREGIFSFSGAPVYDGEKQVLAITLTHDITQQKKAHQSLAEAKQNLEFYKYALDQSSIVATTDSNGTITYVNDKFCEISGYRREELIGQNHRIINSRYHSREFFRELYQTITKGKVWRGEIKNRRKNGTYYWVDTTIVPLLGAKGTPEQYVSIRTDITARKQREEEVMQLSRMLQEHLENTPLAVVEYNPDFSIRMWSGDAQEIFGFTAEEVIGKDLTQIRWIYEEDAEQINSVVKTLLEGSATRLVNTNRNYHKDGSVLECQWYISALRNSEGKLESVLCFGLDVTEQKKSQEALRQSEELYKQTFEHAGAGVAHLGLDGRWLRINRKFCEILGHTHDELMILTRKHVTHPDDLEQDLQLEREIIEGKRTSFHVEKRYIRKDGAIVWAHRTVSLIKHPDGTPAYFIVVIDDITKRKATEAALRDTEEHLRFLTNVTDIMNQSLDYNTSITELAKIMVKRYADWCVVDIVDDAKGIERTTTQHKDPAKLALGERLRELRPMDMNAENGVQKVLRTGKTEFIPLVTKEMIAKANLPPELEKIMDELALKSFITVPLNARGKTLGAMSLAIAESDKSYTNEDVKFLEEVASRVAIAVDNARLYHFSQEALTLRDEFLSIASHELKTPVTSIKAFLQALEQRMHNPDRFDFEKNKQYMQISIKQVDRLASLINDLLDVTRINKGKIDYRFSAMPLGPIIAEVVERLSASFPDHKMLLHLESLTTTAKIDHLRFEQALTNLITNAVKYSPAGSTITVGMKADQHHAFITVNDHGIGITPEQQEHIFSLYYRTTAAIDSRAGGLGVGLYLSREIVRAHGGDITVKSEAGKGSTFTIVLPLANPGQAI